MAESQILSVIRMWAAVAWADGTMAASEADSLNRLIHNAELTEDERDAARGFVRTRTGLPERYLTDLSTDARQGIYHAACRLAVVDLVFSSTERALLDRMRNLLGLPADVARQLESDIPGIPGR